MKGIIFNLLEDVVGSEYDADTWDDLLDRAKVEGVYTSLGNYPHGELVTILDEFSASRGENRDQILRWFGRNAIPLLADRYQVFFAPHRHTRRFLLTLNDVIHSEVRKLYPGADAPMFEFLDSGGGDHSDLTIHYRSRRQLCKLAEGIILGAADYFGEKANVQQRECLLNGDDHCSIHCEFSA